MLFIAELRGAFYPTETVLSKVVLKACKREMFVEENALKMVVAGSENRDLVRYVDDL